MTTTRATCPTCHGTGYERSVAPATAAGALSGENACATCDSTGSVPDLHVITERADGPDLDDLVRLIRYLREHEVQYRVLDAVTYRERDRPDEYRHDPLSVLLYEPGVDYHPRLRSLWTITENKPLAEAHFVDPDGTVYDANREAL